MYRYLLIQILLLYSTAYAQDVQNFSLSGDKYKYFSVDHADVIDQGELNLNSVLNYGKNPLLLTSQKEYLINQLSTLNFTGAYGLIDKKLQLNFDFGYGWSTGLKPKGLDTGSGFNNFKLAPKVNIFKKDKWKISLIFPVGIPLKDTKVLGMTSLLLSMKSIITFQVNTLFDISLNLGYRYRLNTSNEYSLDHAVLYGMGSSYKLNDFSFKAEVYGKYFYGDSINPLEFLVGAKKNEKSWWIEMALGRGITSDYSSVSFRYLFNIGLIYGLDSDKDGIADSVDKCIDNAEDQDNFLDEDGCPDLDNDMDGILDGKDKCINQQEDIDKFEDLDGCPDIDNDNDSLTDALDKCPNGAEVINGIEDYDGCPDGEIKVLDNLNVKNEIYFEKDTALIMPMSYPFIYELAQIINKNDIAEVVIECSSGDLKLAFDRGEAIKKALKGLSVKASLIVKAVESYDEKIDYRVVYTSKILFPSP